MKLRLFLLLIFIISIFTELIFFSFPLMFMVTFIFFSIEFRLRFLIPLAILSVVGDSILLNPLGATLLFVCVLMMFINIYARYLGSRDALVYILLGAIGVVSYAIMFDYSVGEFFKWFIILLSVWIIYRLMPIKHFSL